MTKEILLQKLDKFCPPWIKRSAPSAEMSEILQNAIQQVLPGLLGVKIEQLDKDKIVGSVPFRNETGNVVGFMHGGTIFSTGDTLAGVYLWFISEPEQYAITTRCEIEYLKPLKEGTLHCTVTEKTRDGRKVTLEAAFVDDKGQNISTMLLDYLLMTLKK